ncbi:MAG: PhzF family phenazine biosynthesis protein [Planctomycetota bacterium]
MKLYQVDAFTTRRFHGNPAAVVPLEVWPADDAVLQAIAEENNLSETAFFAPRSTSDHDGSAVDFALRWFTPAAEVELCGHATVGAAHVLWNEMGFDKDTIRFDSKYKGVLEVTREGTSITLDFPELALEPCEAPGDVVRGLGRAPVEVYRGMDLVCVFDNKRHVHELDVDLHALASIEGVRGVAVTAPGAGHDYVCRFFAPRFRVNEDPFTGSLQCMLAPLWAKKLGKNEVTVHQVSARGGEAVCRVNEPAGRIKIAGHAVTYLRGEIEIA